MPISSIRYFEMCLLGNGPTEDEFKAAQHEQRINFEKENGIVKDYNGVIINPSILKLKNKKDNIQFDQLQITVQHLRDIINRYKQDSNASGCLFKSDPMLIKNLKKLESETRKLDSNTPLNHEMLWQLVAYLNSELVFSPSCNSSILGKEYIKNTALRNAWFAFRKLMGANLILLLQCQNQAYRQVSRQEDKRIAFKMICATSSQITAQILRDMPKYKESLPILEYLSHFYLVVEACKHPEYTAALFNEFELTWFKGFEFAHTVTWLIAHNILTEENKNKIRHIYKIDDPSLFDLNNEMPRMSLSEAQKKFDEIIENIHKKEEEKHSAKVKTTQKSAAVFFPVVKSQNVVTASVVPEGLEEKSVKVYK